MTVSELAVELGGTSQRHSRSPVARQVRREVRAITPRNRWPGQGTPWELTPAQAAEIRRRLKP